MIEKKYIYLIFLGSFLILCPLGNSVFAEVMSVSLNDKINMEFVRIPAGIYEAPLEMYRTPEGPKPLGSFYLGKYEVTQAQWVAVMGSWPVELLYNATASVCLHDEKPSRVIISYKMVRQRGEDVRIKEIGVGDDYPVYFITFYDAAHFCNALSIAQGLQPCYKIEEYGIVWDEDSDGYRLPTDDEWEYAAVCGSLTRDRYYWGKEIDEAYMNSVNKNIVASPTLFIPVGQKLPNSWGLHDMIGNVLEWSWYRLPPPLITEEHVERWRNDPMESWRIHTEPVHPSHSIRGQSLRSSDGGNYGADYLSWDFGFRVARTIFIDGDQL